MKREQLVGNRRLAYVNRINRYNLAWFESVIRKIGMRLTGFVCILGLLLLAACTGGGGGDGKRKSPAQSEEAKRKVENFFKGELSKKGGYKKLYDGKFLIELIIVKDPKGLEPLRVPGRYVDNKDTIRKLHITKLEKGDPVHAAVILGGMGSNNENKGLVSADFYLTGPDGNVQDKGPNVVLWDGPVVVFPEIAAPLETFKFQVYPAQKSGNYTVQTNVYDHFSGVSMELKRTLNVK